MSAKQAIDAIEVLKRCVSCSEWDSDFSELQDAIKTAIAESEKEPMAEPNNKRLIAAAPKMLEALKQCVVFFREHIKPDFYDLQDLIDAAIAEAEGTNETTTRPNV